MPHREVFPAIYIAIEEINMRSILKDNVIYYDTSPTVLPAKSDSDVMFCLQCYQGLIAIDRLCINPILRIGLIHK